jgi:hypothetical protein
MNNKHASLIMWLIFSLFYWKLISFFGEGGVGGEDDCTSTIKVRAFITVLLLLITDRPCMSFTKEPEIVVFS